MRKADALVRVLVGLGTPVTPEDGHVIRVATTLGRELVHRGDAVWFGESDDGTGGEGNCWRGSTLQTAPVGSSRTAEIWRNTR